MNKLTSQWTQKELKAYILLYAANSNQNVSEEEREFIESKFDKTTLTKMSKELQNDNDYQRLQKILKSITHFNYTSSDIDKLLEEVKFISMTDGAVDVVERSTHSFLTKILRD